MYAALFLIDMKALAGNMVYRFQCRIRMFIIFGAIPRKLRKSDLPVKESRFRITFTFMKLEIQKVFLAPREGARGLRTSWGSFCLLTKYFRWRFGFSYPSYTTYFYTQSENIGLNTPLAICGGKQFNGTIQRTKKV